MAAVDLSLSGLASGFDWKSFIDQIVQVERAPEQTLLTDKSKLTQKNAAFGNIKTQLTALQTSVTALKNATLFDSRSAQSSDSTVASALATSGAAVGAYTFNVTQLATASRINGPANVGNPLSPTNNVSTLALADAGFPAAVTPGTFTVNGRQITIVTTDTLQQVFDKIATATANTVTGSYDPATDHVVLSSSGEIVLGSATDSSNFLQTARLYNNGTGSIASTQALGSVRLTGTLSGANLATPVSDGGAGAGEFKINGVSIAFSETDSLAGIVNRINASAAGVTASYDAVNDRFSLASKATGDIGIGLEDVTGNFLAATGLTAGTLTHGQNMIYTVNGSDPLISQSNTITETSSGIAGLSVTALKENSSVTVTVGSDTAKIKTAIQGFVDAYNKVQSLIDTQTTSSTDAKGAVTAGILAGDNDADQIASSLRHTVYALLGGLSGTMKHLADLGIVSNGNNNNIALDDSDKLDSALANNLNGVKEFFSDETNGMAVSLDKYLTKTIGDEGTLVAHQNNLTKQSGDIDTQIAAMEKTIQDDKDRMTAQFVAMETAQAKINQQLQFLSQQINKGF